MLVTATLFLLTCGGDQRDLTGHSSDLLTLHDSSLLSSPAHSGFRELGRGAFQGRVRVCMAGSWAPCANKHSASSSSGSLPLSKPSKQGNPMLRDSQKAAGRDKTMGLLFLWQQHLRVRG